MTIKSKIRSLTGAALAMAAASALTVLSPNGFAQTPSPDFHIYLAFGQSNMEGNGTVPAAEKTGVNPRFQVLAAVNCPTLSRTKGTWYTAVPPLCRCGTGMTPADYFGRTLVDSLPATIKVGVIVVAVAGTSIQLFDKAKYQAYLDDDGTADWLVNIANEYGGNPYKTLVDLGKQAQKEGVIKGFLLHQGETDAGNSQWPNMVKTVYTNLITDLGLDAAKTPLLAGDLGAPNANIAKLPTVIPNSHVIPSTGLPRSDAFHFTPEGYKEFGKRYGSAMLGILKKSATTPIAASPAMAGFAMGDSFPGRDGMGSIHFEIPQSGFVSVKAYTLGGKEIAELAGKAFPAGGHTLEFAGKLPAAGIRILKMKAGAFTATRRVVVGAQ